MSHYRPFVVLSTPRSGTHMLRTSLDNHRHVVCMTEMFNPDYTRDTYPFTETTPGREILDNHIFVEHPVDIKAVGFCIHRHGARSICWPAIWQVLAEYPDLHVIDLRRENLLRRYLSVKLRKLRDLEIEASQSMRFDYSDLTNDFLSVRSHFDEFERRFKHCPCIRVTYEQLCSDYENTMRRVQEFLGLPWEQLKPSTGKRATPKLTSIVANYQELKMQAVETPYQKFFDE